MKLDKAKFRWHEDVLRIGTEQTHDLEPEAGTVKGWSPRNAYARYSSWGARTRTSLTRTGRYLRDSKSRYSTF